VRGKVGRVVGIHGEFRNPESLAYGGDGLPRRPLYLVSFRQTDVWGSRYAGPAADTLTVDIYEHWLEPA
jgi:nitrile hydratase